MKMKVNVKIVMRMLMKVTVVLPMMLMMMMMMMMMKPLGPPNVRVYQTGIAPHRMHSALGLSLLLTCVLGSLAGSPPAPKGPKGEGPFGPPPAVPEREPPLEPADPQRAKAAGNSDDEFSLDSALLTPEMGSQDGISESSDFDLVLQDDDLDNAKARLSTLYRRELSVQNPTATTRSTAGKMSWFQRDTASCTWEELLAKAPRYLTNERYADWDNWRNAHARGHRGAGERDLLAHWRACLAAWTQQNWLLGLTLRYDKIALLQAVHSHSDKAQALQHTVHQALATIDATELHQVRDSINRALLDAVEQHFPPSKPTDTRISAAGGFRASASRTWQLYRELKAVHTVTPHSVFRQWQAAAAFAKASKALRVQSRLLKKTSVLHKLAEAEHAADKGDQKVLYQIVRSLTPNKRQVLSRLRDPQGRLLDPVASLQAMLQYARDTFSVHADDPVELCMTQGLDISDQAVQHELQKLGSIAGLLGPALRLHFQVKLIDLLQQQEQQDAQLPVTSAEALAVQPSCEDHPPDTATGVSQNVPLCEMTDPSQGLNPEADIFAFCNPTLLQSKTQRSSPLLPKDKETEEHMEGSEESTQPPKRPRPEPNMLMASRQQSAFNPRRQQRPPKNNGLSAEARLMARMLLYHEDQLAAQRMDKDFVLFMRQSGLRQRHPQSPRHFGGVACQEGRGGRGPHLLTTHPVAGVLDQGTAGPGPKVGIDSGGSGKAPTHQQWTFLRWCHRTKKLVVDDNKPSLSHTELVRQLTFLLENLRGDIIRKFHSTKGLDKVEENASNLPSVTFLLGISLRGERAHEIHEVLCKLLGSSAWQLVGVSMKREGLQRAPAAKQLAKMLFGKSFLGTWQGRRLIDNADMQRYMDLHGEEWIASQIYLLEVQLRQMCQDMGILQQRHNNLHYQISLLMRNQRHLAQQLMSKSSPNKYRQTPQLIDLHELDD
ncbi:hypothetical protein AK812_SmicGene29269 [Symbiodinium microadriaticum]|uniref:Uncharacterized protein n=1 Tax=Symbiodinium microadriaticum TaxID=2951 RepID=A0A1Q9D286_SYMMI|nr:hypothetical protein AK812_SmicGene29269 [Symbiodinium microadriaticum]CAE7226352.1 unnamed protein product [Symbiodinium sp. KB8]CAE7238742.1 unnamed protein product [Symbiodinium microadriaticum]